MQRNEILNWLHETDPQALDALWTQADSVRRAHVGDAVHLRGLIELSNHCVRLCGYCGLRAPNREITRYRMTADEIIECARQAAVFGYGTVVLQAGEDPELTTAFVADVVRRIKSETGVAVTLSLGEVDEATLRTWRDAGADRYLLRFETSNPALFARIHPSRAGREYDRQAVLRWLRELGFEVGSGAMVGVPGQTYDDLANDIELFAALDLDMIGVGPFLPHPATPLGTEGGKTSEVPLDSAQQVPNTELMTYKVVALARLVCPWANIPSTTALATLNRAQGRELGLMRGANIVMPNLTPPRYRSLYEIYPAKACLYETAEQCHGCMAHRITALGRTIGSGPGISPNWQARQAAGAGREE
jgi:biotin synthase